MLLDFFSRPYKSTSCIELQVVLFLLSSSEADTIALIQRNLCVWIQIKAKPCHAMPYLLYLYIQGHRMGAIRKKGISGPYQYIFCCHQKGIFLCRRKFIFSFFRLVFRTKKNPIRKLTGFKNHTKNFAVKCFTQLCSLFCCETKHQQIIFVNTVTILLKIQLSSRQMPQSYYFYQKILPFRHEWSRHYEKNDW